MPLKLREAYISRTESLFAAMAKISGKEVMLDITGSPGRLAALSLCPNLKVIPLLLVRDVSEEAQEIPPLVPGESVHLAQHQFYFTRRNAQIRKKDNYTAERTIPTAGEGYPEDCDTH